MKFIFTKYSAKQWEKIDGNRQNILRQKIGAWKDDSLLFKQNLKPFLGISPATHRARIGTFRLLLQCDFESNQHIVLKIGHRRDIYQ